MIHPILSKTFPLAEVGESAYEVHQNLHTGKLGVLVMAPEEGLGVSDPELRAKHKDKIELFKRFE
jgi:crotonyl-CoA reductase